MRRFADVFLVFAPFVAYTLLATATIRGECLTEESPNPVDKLQSIDSLVDDLSSDQFRQRQRAFQALLDRGVEVLPHVLQAIKASDGESSQRAFQILSRLLESSNAETRKLAQAKLKRWLETDAGDAKQRIQRKLLTDQLSYAQVLIDLGASVIKDGLNVIEVDCRGSSAIKDEHLWVLQHFPELQRLSVQSTRIGDDGIAHVRGLNKLSVLNLYRSQVGDEGLRIIAQLPSLRHVAAGETRITDAGLVHLADKTQMTYVGLRANAITDAGLAHLKKLTNLTGIYLGGTQITDAGLLHLAGMREMQYIRIHETAITDKALKLLAKLPKLEALLIYDTNVTDAGLERLKRQLPNLHISTS